MPSACLTLILEIWRNDRWRAPRSTSDPEGPVKIKLMTDSSTKTLMRVLAGTSAIIVPGELQSSENWAENHFSLSVTFFSRSNRQKKTAEAERLRRKERILKSCEHLTWPSTNPTRRPGGAQASRNGPSSQPHQQFDHTDDIPSVS